MAARPIFVVAGVGNASGTGCASALVFSKAGYRVALIPRANDDLTKFTGELKAAGGEGFPVSAYSYKEVQSAFGAIRKPDAVIRVALYNGGIAVWKLFLDIAEGNVDTVIDTNVNSAFAFAKEAIRSCKDLLLNDNGKRGTLLFTGAIASIKGAARFVLRSLDLAKEFGNQNIHIAHAVIDSHTLSTCIYSTVVSQSEFSPAVVTDKQRVNHNSDWGENLDVYLSPESIAKAYLYLANQDRSAWTWELGLRPAHANW